MLAPEPNPVTGLPKRKAATTLDPFGVPRVTSPAVGGGTTLDPFGVPRVQAPPAAPIGTLNLPGAFGATGSTTSTAPAPAPSAPPDYTGLINNDPVYKQTQADIAATHAADQGALDDLRKRALVNYGAVPDIGGYQGLTGDLSGSMTDLVRGLAGENTASGLSTTARINKAHTDAVDAVKSALTARGLLSSGETGYQLGEENNSYQQAGYDALQQLIDLLSGGNRSFLDAEAQRRSTLAQAASDAAGRIPPGTTPVVPAPGGSGPVATPDITQPVSPIGNVIPYNPGGQVVRKTPRTIADIAQELGGQFSNPNGIVDPTPAPPLDAGGDVTQPLSSAGDVIPYNPGGPVAQPQQSLDEIAQQLGSQFGTPSASAQAPKKAPAKKPANAAGASSVANKIKGKNL